MQIENVDIQVGKAGVPDGARKVLALCDETWAIHPCGISYADDGWGDGETDGDGDEPLFKLTHRPTGYAALVNVTWEECLETLREIRASTLTWNFTDPTVAKSMGEAWKAIRATVRERLSPAQSVELPLADPAVVAPVGVTTE